MKKRLFALLLALCMMFIAAACSNQESDADDSDQNQTEEASVEKTADENSEYETVEIHEASDVDQMSEPEKGETIAIVKVKDYGEMKFKFFPQYYISSCDQRFHDSGRRSYRNRSRR